MPIGNAPDSSLAAAGGHPGIPGRSVTAGLARRLFLVYRCNARRLTALGLIVGVLSAAPAVKADTRGDAEVQVAFGIPVAQAGLWREARLRFERAVQVDPTYAAAWNDLAIVYEQLGAHHRARAAYQRALALAPKDADIQQNFELFKEIHDRMTKAPCARPPC